MIATSAVNFNRPFVVSTEDNLKFQLAPTPAPELLAELAEAKPADCPAVAYVLGRSSGSQPTLWGALGLIAAILTSNRTSSPLAIPWHQLKRNHVLAVRRWLEDHRSPATGNKILSALRGTLKEAWRMELLTAEQYLRLEDIPVIRGSRTLRSARRSLTYGELTQLIDACLCDPTPAGIRDAAIIGLAARSGLRRQEIASLQQTNYTVEQKQLAVIGKGNKERIVYVAPGADQALADWLNLRKSAGITHPALFQPINKGGNIQDRPISVTAIYDAIAKRADLARIAHFTPHDLRATFTGDLLDAGVDLATVQKLMGHSSPTTTSRYDRRHEEAKRNAINKLTLPYRR